MDPGPSGPYRYWEFTPEPTPVAAEEDATESILDPNLVKSLTGFAKKSGIPVGIVLGLATIAGGYSMVGGGGRGIGRRGGQRGFANFRKPCNELGTNRNPNKLGPLPDAIGEHSTSRRGPDGIVTNYEVYDLNPVTGLFGAKKRFRGVGKPHNGVDPPFVLERAPGKGPGSTPSTVRAPEPWELPGGY